MEDFKLIIIALAYLIMGVVWIDANRIHAHLDWNLGIWWFLERIFIHEVVL